MNILTQPTAAVLRDLEEVFARYEPLQVRYEPDELICQVGSYAAGVYLVTSGIVQESYADPGTRGNRVSMGLLGPGELIGIELQLPDNERLHRTTCRAVTRVSLSFLERTAFAAAVEQHELLRRFLATHLAERCFGLAHALWRSQLEASMRLSTLLFDLIRFGEPASPGHIALPPQVDLRLLAGLSHLSHRQVKRVCASLPGVSWNDEEQLVFSPDEFSCWSSQETVG